MSNLLFAIWFFLPAGCANMTPIFASKMPWLRNWTYPLDAYMKFREKRILGDHKTVRGLLSGVVIGMAIAYLQTVLYQHNPLLFSFVPASFMEVNPIVFGGVSGLGALVGDAVKSFFKRQMKVPSGKSWFPFDQIDYIVGGIIATACIYRLPMMGYLYIVLVYFGLHLLVSYIGYLLRFKDAPI